MANAQTKTPSYLEMIKEAITATDGKSGASIAQIKAHICGTYQKDPDKISHYLKKALEKGLETNALSRPKGQKDFKGLTGKILIGSVAKPERAKEQSKVAKTKEAAAKPLKETNTKAKPAATSGSTKRTPASEPKKERKKPEPKQTKKEVVATKQSEKPKTKKNAAPIKKATQRKLKNIDIDELLQVPPNEDDSSEDSEDNQRHNQREEKSDGSRKKAPAKKATQHKLQNGNGNRPLQNDEDESEGESEEDTFNAVRNRKLTPAELKAATLSKPTEASDESESEEPEPESASEEEEEVPINGNDAESAESLDESVKSSNEEGTESGTDESPVKSKGKPAARGNPRGRGRGRGRGRK